MLSHTQNFPAFDKAELELITDDYNFTRFEKFSPAKAGDSIAAFQSVNSYGRWHRFFDEIAFNHNARTFSYARKPLLLYFFEQEWGDTARKNLLQLNILNKELQARQINLLVVTSGSLKSLLELSWNDSLSLEVFEDKNNELASLLKIYSERNPTWSRYAGIDANLPLPALYLLDHNRRVAWAHANEAISPTLPLKDIYASVNTSNEYFPARISA